MFIGAVSILNRNMVFAPLGPSVAHIRASDADSHLSTNNPASLLCPKFLSVRSKRTCFEILLVIKMILTDR